MKEATKKIVHNRKPKSNPIHTQRHTPKNETKNKTKLNKKAHFIWQE